MGCRPDILHRQTYEFALDCINRGLGLFRYFLVPSSRRTRLIVLALTPWHSANSTSVDPVKYEAARLSGSIAARPTMDGAPDPAAGTTDVCDGCASTSCNVLTSGFAGSGWFE